jgi:hypothetical protein
VLAVLHTWGQQLEHHPHVHAVVPGGSLTSDGQRWLACRPNFLLPVKVLGKVFRGKYLEGLRQAYVAGALPLGGSTAALAEPRTFAVLLDELYRTSWVVYAQQPFGRDPELVLKYLARYQPWTCRAAGCAARIPVRKVIRPRILEHGQRLNLGKTDLPCTRPACTASAFGDRIPQMPARCPD